MQNKLLKIKTGFVFLKNGLLKKWNGNANMDIRGMILFFHIKEENYWCPFCSGRRRSKQDMYQEVLEVVLQKQGKCLSKEYINARELMLFECFNKHQWRASSLNIKQGKWCPHCSKYLTENKCRYIFESLLQNKFMKHRFVHNGQKLELDGYNFKLSLAFEYQGEQHYRLVKKWHKDLSGFERQRCRDKQKIEYCKQHQINLVIIPFNAFNNDDQDLIKFIGDRVKKYKPNSTEFNNVNFSKFYEKCSPLTELKEIAKSKNGELISNQYNGTNKKLTWLCHNGHYWNAAPSSIKSGNWCPKCAIINRWITRKNNIINNIDIEMAKRGGKCLTRKYDSHIKMQWQCSKNHIWEALWGNIKRGYWCPVCKMSSK